MLLVRIDIQVETYLFAIKPLIRIQNVYLLTQKCVSYKEHSNILSFYLRIILMSDTKLVHFASQKVWLDKNR